MWGRKLHLNEDTEWKDVTSYFDLIKDTTFEMYIFSRCFQCGSDMTGKVPFEYSDFKFCSPKCLKQHRMGEKKTWSMQSCVFILVLNVFRITDGYCNKLLIIYSNNDNKCISTILVKIKRSKQINSNFLYDF